MLQHNRLVYILGLVWSGVTYCKGKGKFSEKKKKKKIRQKFAPFFFFFFFAAPPKLDGWIVIRPKMLGRVENGTKNPHFEKVIIVSTPHKTCLRNWSPQIR